MQQEDDLRGLAKVMEFMRAISIVFIVIHVYWFCYSAFVDMGINIGVVDRILLNFQKTAGLFSNLLVTKVFAFIFLGLSCLGTKGVKNQKMTWQKIYAAFLGGIVLFFMNWWMLEVSCPAVQYDSECYRIYADAYHGLHSPAYVGNMDQPYAEAQPYGRRIQHRQRKFHAGNKAYGKRVFRKPAHEICLSG